MVNKAPKITKRVTRGATSGVTSRTTGSASRSIKEMFKNVPVKVAAITDKPDDAGRAPGGRSHAGPDSGPVIIPDDMKELISVKGKSDPKFNDDHVLTTGHDGSSNVTCNERDQRLKDVNFKRADSVSNPGRSTSVSAVAHLGGGNPDPYLGRDSIASVDAVHFGEGSPGPIPGRDPKVSVDDVHMDKKNPVNPGSGSAPRVMKDVAEPTPAPRKAAAQHQIGERSKVTAYFQKADSIPTKGSNGQVKPRNVAIDDIIHISSDPDDKSSETPPVKRMRWASTRVVPDTEDEDEDMDNEYPKAPMDKQGSSIAPLDMQGSSNAPMQKRGSPKAPTEKNGSSKASMDKQGSSKASKYRKGSSIAPSDKQGHGGRYVEVFEEGSHGVAADSNSAQERQRKRYVPDQPLLFEPCDTYG